MRIIAGQWRGRKLSLLGKGDDAARLRPTPDRVRESLFSMLDARDAIAGAQVLDLFSGTGALAFEALSRGAEHAICVENGRVGQRLIAANIRLLDADATLLKSDATKLRTRDGPQCDLVFMDPPYGKGLGEKALMSAKAGGWIAPNALIIAEDSAPLTPPTGFELDSHRRFGDSHLTLLRVAEA